MTSNNHDELLDHARRVIRDLRARLAAVEAPSHPEPIAIVGMAFRFPGAGTNPDRLWKMFTEGRDAVGPVPADRWNGEEFLSRDPATPGKSSTARGAFLDEVRRFDAGFFDITPREAMHMDPQQRLFLETAWHALEDAGLARNQVAGSETGVFVGVHNHSSDYQVMQFEKLESLDAWSATGTAHDMIAGRLAYWLDLHGPAIAVNTACSSSLAAVHLACRSLRAGDCTTAIAAGVNLLLSPGSTIAASQMQLLSPDGHCRTFDSRVKGMGRGEGCGVVVLKKLSAAQQAGDRVLAVIRGSAMNQDGRTNGLTAPNGLAQQRVLQRALAEAGLQPDEVGYVETHGTGTALGDPIEVEAIAAVFGRETRLAPCTLGAVKANLGHLEGAAGIAGLIKTVMVLRRRWIPPVANLQQLNPHVILEGTGLEIPRSGRAWPANQPRIAGVSSFGWSGTNVHVLVEEAPVEKRLSSDCGTWPVVISAQTPEALRKVTEAFADRLDSADIAELPAISYTSTVRRTAHTFRIAAMGSQPREIARQLRRRIDDTAARNGSEEARQDERLSRWERGDEQNWSSFFPHPIGVADLPHYPFQGREYWMAEGSARQTRSAVAQKSLGGGEGSVAVPDSWFYSVELFANERDSRIVRSEERPVWLLMGRETAPGLQISRAIRNRGEELVEVFTSGGGEPGIPAGERLAEGISRCGAGSSLYVLWFPEHDEPSAITSEALSVVQSLLPLKGRARLWFVTEIPERAGSSGGPVSSALHSFSRVAGLEHPELIGGVIAADRESAFHVCAEIDTDGGEDNVLLRAGRRWVPRLQRESRVRSAPLQLRGDRSYLVTGAFGAIGMEVAEWLIAAGARHLVLAGRRNPSEMGKPHLLDRLGGWRASGVEVRDCACDVADESQVRAMLDAMDAAGTPLAGLIHAAACARFSPVGRASAEDVREVFRAKLEGAQILDRCTRARQMDFFVLFGSAAATVGLRDGAIYAAANAALHSVAEARREQGLPSLCVEWGSWVSDHTGSQSTLIERSGFASMQPQAALSALSALIGNGGTRAIVADVDWRILGAALALRGRDALVSRITPEAGELLREEGGAAAAWVDSLRLLTAEEQLDRLLGMAAAEARGIFGMRPEDPLQEDRGLFAMGMDSLMAVRLKRRLEERTALRLPGTVTLTYPTLISLAEYLRVRLFGVEEGIAQSPAPAAIHRDLSTVAALDDEQTRAAIEEELAAAQRTLVKEQK